MNQDDYKKFIKFEKNLLLALFLIDDTDNHIYFAHKYKISNHLKEYLNFIHTHYKLAQKNKNFFVKDLKKNTFYHGKEKMKSLAKFHFLCSSKIKYETIDDVLEKITSINIPEFPITGKYLLEKGFKSGTKVGEILKKIENRWIENDFDLKDEELQKLIKKYN